MALRTALAAQKWSQSFAAIVVDPVGEEDPPGLGDVTAEDAETKENDAAADQESEEEARRAAVEWRAMLRAIFEVALAETTDQDQKAVIASIEEQTIQAAQERCHAEHRKHAAAMARVRKQAAWQQSTIEKKLKTMRSASATQGKQDVLKLEQKQKEATRELNGRLHAESIGSRILCRELADSEYAANLYASKLTIALREGAELEERVAILGGEEERLRLEREKHVKYLGESAMRRMANQQLAWGWSTWIVACEETARLRAAVKYLVNSHVGRCFTTWAAVAEALRDQHARLKKAGARLTKPQTVACFRHWRRDWEAAQHDKAKGVLQAEARELRRQLQAAQEEARESQRLRDQILQQMGDIERREAIAREGWAASEKRESEARQAWMEKLYERAARRLMHLDVSKGFFAWKEDWEERTVTAQRLKAVVGRLLKPRRAAGFATWKADWQEELARRIKETEKAKEAQQLEMARRLEEKERALTATAQAQARAAELRAAEVRAAQLRAEADLDSSGDSYSDTESDERADSGEGGPLMEGRRPSVRRDSSRRQSVRRQSIRDNLLVLSQLQEDLVASEATAKLAREEAEFLATMVAKQQEELEGIRRAAGGDAAVRHALESDSQRLKQEMENVRKACEAQIIHCGKQLLACQRELAQAKEDRVRSDDELHQLKEQLKSVGAPLASEQRKGLLKAMHLQMEQMTEAVAANHLQRIRELAQLVALRDRQLSRAGSSPRPISPQPTARSANLAAGLAPHELGRSLDSKPMDHVDRTSAHGFASSFGSTGRVMGRALGRPASATPPDGIARPRSATASHAHNSKAADLFVAPSFPEADGYSREMAKIDATERAQMLQDVKTAAEDPSRQRRLAPSGASSGGLDYKAKAINSGGAGASWESPFKRRGLVRPRSATALPHVLA